MFVLDLGLFLVYFKGYFAFIFLVYGPCSFRRSLFGPFGFRNLSAVLVCHLWRALYVRLAVIGDALYSLALVGHRLGFKVSFFF
ncbi:hypothetical protein AQUCO_01200253v1 [Aquilegia coerulea]|uniref:Uncharacterized protein n=1 Tax=Aquilegia coerulea TaxID=218851 RepID=A0A2G5E511_AQUCA|nr:hypothetical protein AQUCO_01200253v1 [Aquilegia coerulea]